MIVSWRLLVIYSKLTLSLRQFLRRNTCKRSPLPQQHLWGDSLGSLKASDKSIHTTWVSWGFLRTRLELKIHLKLLLITKLTKRSHNWRRPSGAIPKYQQGFWPCYMLQIPKGRDRHRLGKWLGLWVGLTGSNLDFFNKGNKNEILWMYPIDLLNTFYINMRYLDLDHTADIQIHACTRIQTKLWLY